MRTNRAKTKRKTMTRATRSECCWQHVTHRRIVHRMVEPCSRPAYGSAGIPKSDRTRRTGWRGCPHCHRRSPDHSDSNKATCGKGICGRCLGSPQRARECSRDNALTEETGIIYLSNAGYNFQTGSKPLKARPVRSCCAKTVLADNHSVAGSLVIDLADQVVCGLNFKPFQSMLPELRSVARKHHEPA